MSNTQNITHANLANFYGSQDFFRHPLFRKFVYTEGCHFLMENGAAWLVEAILSHGCHMARVAKEEFVHIVLLVNLEAKKARLYFTDGNIEIGALVLSLDVHKGKPNKHLLAMQDIEYTDFPLPQVEFYLENNTLMLPSER